MNRTASQYNTLLSDIKIPLLIMHGTDDRVVSLQNSLFIINIVSTSHDNRKIDVRQDMTITLEYNLFMPFLLL